MNKRVFLISIIAGGITLLAALFFAVEAMTTEHLAYRFGFIGYGGTLYVSNPSFPWYEMCFGFGVLAAIFMLAARSRMYGANTVMVIKVTVAFVLSGYLGAKILYIIENWGQDFSSYLSFGGLSLFGAVFGMPLCSFFFAKILRMDRKQYMDYIIPAALALLGCVRLGCFIKGCCGGITVWLDKRPLIIPTQLIESSLDFFFMAILVNLEFRRKLTGKHYTVFFLGYGVYRFLLEYIRKTTATSWGLTNGQLLSLLCIVIGVISVIINLKFSSKSHK